MLPGTSVYRQRASCLPQSRSYEFALQPGTEQAQRTLLPSMAGSTPAPLSFQETIDRVAQHLDGDTAAQTTASATLQVMLSHHPEEAELGAVLRKLAGLVSAADAHVQASRPHAHCGQAPPPKYRTPSKLNCGT